MDKLTRKVSKMFGSSQKDEEPPALQIGAPKNYDHTIKVTSTKEGGLSGLPKELEHRLRTILTVEDQKNKATMQTATDALNWLQHYMTDQEQERFMEPERQLSVFDEHDLQSEITANASGPGLVRTKTKKKGPRISKTMGKDEVMRELKTICVNDSPNAEYKTDREVGAGACGRVYLATHRKTGQFVAIKCIDLSKQPKLQMLLMEIKCMKEINHPNLVNYIGNV